MVSSNGLARPSRTKVTVTLVPFGPRSLLTASWVEIGLVLSPLMWVMMSPGWTPRRQAGVPSIGRDDDQVVLLLLDLHPDAEVLAPLLLGHAGEAVGLEEIGVGVERLEHALDGFLGQVVLVHRLVVGRAGRDPSCLRFC